MTTLTPHLESLRLDNKEVGADVIGVLQELNVTRTIDGASSLEISLHDPHRRLLGLDIFQKGTRCTYEGHAYRLVALSGESDTLQVTFEDETVWLLRQNFKKKVVKRKKMTRVEFARAITLETPGIDFYGPEASDAAPQPKLGKGDHRVNKGRSGFDNGVSFDVHGAPATTTQKQNLERVLGVGVQLKAFDRVLKAMIETVIQESSAMNLTDNNPTDFNADSVGMFQQRPSTGWTGLRNIEKAARQFLLGQRENDRGAIYYSKKYPNWAPWEIAAAVQQPKAEYRKRYDRWSKEADRILELYNRPDWSVIIGATDRVQFSRGLPGQPESTWDTLQRLADEVGWRCFPIGRTIYFVSEQWLFASKAQATWSPDPDSDNNQGIQGIDFNYDVGKPESSVTVSATTYAEIGNPGDCIALEDMGPVSGKWLLYQIYSNLGDDEDEFSLHKPRPKLAEPPLEYITQNDLTDHATVGQAVVKWALERAHAGPGHVVVNASGHRYMQPWYVYGAKHSLSLEQMRATPNAQPPFDCSSFAAFAWAINGNVYIGDNTTTQIAAAKANPRVLKGTTKPSGGFEPGDLVFPHPDHVAIVIDDKTTISAHSPALGISRAPMYGEIYFWCRWSTAVGNPQ